MGHKSGLIHHKSEYEGRFLINEDVNYFYIDKNIEIGDDFLLKIPERWRTKKDLLEYLRGTIKIIEENF